MGGHGPVNGWHGSMEIPALSSILADSPLGRVWSLICYYKEGEMNLSSCVADSVVLSFDSAGQTLGSGTNSSPSVIFSAVNTDHNCTGACKGVLEEGNG